MVGTQWQLVHLGLPVSLASYFSLLARKIFTHTLLKSPKWCLGPQRNVQIRHRHALPLGGTCFSRLIFYHGCRQPSMSTTWPCSSATPGMHAFLPLLKLGLLIKVYMSNESNPSSRLKLFQELFSALPSLHHLFSCSLFWGTCLNFCNFTDHHIMIYSSVSSSKAV